MDSIIEALIALGPLGLILAISVLGNVAQWRRNNELTDQRLEDWRKHSEAKALTDQRQLEVMMTLQGSVNSLTELVKMGRTNG